MDGATAKYDCEAPADRAADGSSPQNVVAPPNVVPPKPRTFLDKINPFSRNKTAPAALPQHPANPIPNNAARAPQRAPGAAPIPNGVNQAGAKEPFWSAPTRRRFRRSW